MAQQKPTSPLSDLTCAAREIAGLQTTWTREWHAAGAQAPAEPLLALIQEEHRRNFDLWHQEDKARSPEATDATIAAVKRAIDKLNQQRNDLIEKVDERIVAELERRKVVASADAPWNSETPGSAIDRLSILSLKVFHMREQSERQDASAEHLGKCRQRLALLERQHADLTAALQQLLNDLFAGRKQMKIYRQFKMYNDPDSNPEIYKSRKAR